MEAPATLAARIAQAVQPGTGICPICAAIHKLTAKGGRLPRHGFTARNVRHGQNGGFHIGGHGGDLPIGTKAGNIRADRIAFLHGTTADRLAAEAPYTLEDASLAARQEMAANERERAARRQGRAAAAAIEVPAEAEVKVGGMWGPYSGWLSRDALASRARDMEAHRAQTIADHRAHAALLVALVSLHTDRKAA